MPKKKREDWAIELVRRAAGLNAPGSKQGVNKVVQQVGESGQAIAHVTTESEPPTTRGELSK
jgi:hypothetical protein